MVSPETAVEKPVDNRIPAPSGQKILMKTLNPAGSGQRPAPGRKFIFLFQFLEGPPQDGQLESVLVARLPTPIE